MCAFATLAACSAGKADHPATALPPADTTSDPATVVPPPSTTAASSTAPMISPTKSGRAQLPPKPSGASDHSVQGAEQAAKYWLELLTYAMETGDTSPFKEVSSKTCETCQNFAGAIDGYIPEGDSVSAESRFRLISAVGNSGTGSVLLDFTFVTCQIRVSHNDDGKSELGDPPETARTTAHLIWRDSRWLIEKR